MAQTTLNVRIDENTKKQFDAFCSMVGMNSSTAVNLFVKAVLRQKKIPFEISAVSFDPFYSKENLSHLSKAIEELNAGNGAEHDLIEVSDEENME